jgi:hypothetical protein
MLSVTQQTSLEEVNALTVMTFKAAPNRTRDGKGSLKVSAG